MTTARLAIVSCVAVLLAAGAVRGLRAGPADAPPVSKPAPSAPEPPPPAGATPIGTGQFRHTGWHSRVFFTDGGNTLLVVGEGVVVRWWDVQTGKKLHDITLEGGHQDAAFAPAADLLAVAGSHQPGGEDGKSEHVLWLIDAAARKLVRTVTLPSRVGGNHQKVRVGADGKRVFVENEGNVQVIDGKTGDELLRQTGAAGGGALAVSRDGKLVAFGRYDVFLWRWETGEEPKKFTTVGNFGTELMQFSPDGKTLSIVPHGEVVTTWDVATGRQTGSRALRALVDNLEFSPDGKTLAVASHPAASRPPEGGHAIDLLDVATWGEVGRIPLGRIGVEHVSWSKDGSRLAGVTDYRAWAWDVKTGKVLGPGRPGHEGMISAMAFGPDGTLFTASDDHTIRSWGPATGTQGLVLVHDGWVRDLAVSPDGALVAGSALRNDLRVWDARTGKQRLKLLGNGVMGGKRRVRFTPDGKRLVAWGDDEFVRVWEVRNGKLLSERSTRPPGKEGDPDDPFGDRMRFMEASFEAADISPDGAALALSTGNGIRILDPATGKERQTLPVGENRPNPSRSRRTRSGWRSRTGGSRSRRSSPTGAPGTRKRRSTPSRSGSWLPASPCGPRRRRGVGPRWRTARTARGWRSCRTSGRGRAGSGCGTRRRGRRPAGSRCRAAATSSRSTEPANGWRFRSTTPPRSCTTWRRRSSRRNDGPRV
jgi:WD40 repeat protein